MSEHKRNKLKLRAAFLVPAIVIVVVLTLVNVFVVDISRLTIWLFPVVVIGPLIGLVLTERRRGSTSV